MSKPRAEILRDAWNQSGAPLTQWVVEARADEVIVVDDADPNNRTFVRIPAVISGDRVVFGRAEPYDPETEKVLVYASAAESRPTVPPVEPAPDPEPDPAPEPDDDQQNPPADPEPAPQPPAAEPDNAPTDPKEGEGHVSTLSTDVRTRLGLPDDASDADVLAALDNVKAKADTADEQIAASAAADKERDELRAEVKVLASTVESVTAKLAEVEKEKAATIKASVLDDAVKQGKIKPADRDQWAKDYDDAPAAVTRVLASIAPGTAVPVSPTGYTGSTETTADEDAEWDALVSRLDGPTAAKGA